MSPHLHPADERALKLTQAFRDYDLDTIAATLGVHALSRPLIQVHSNLRQVFIHAQADDIDLLQPPAHFHTWLQRPLATPNRGPGPLKINTLTARVVTLRVLYEALITEGVLTTNPMTGYPNPGTEHASDPVPEREDIEQLLKTAKASTPELFAALTLIHEHAFQVRELLGLKWSRYEPSTGELLRARTVTILSEPAQRALEPLLKEAGGPLYATENALPIFPITPEDLRTQLWKACKVAEIPHIPLSALRRASLRDHPARMTGSGFSNDQAYRRALRLAGKVVDKHRKDEP
ncbi:hypothetical protein LAJ19_20430 (plasmid) [Deinococcus taeanensis]|uniref:hypothetical protein n=1 Tax=Deinococcus taeanensis TaxID=2737050 RepID=UPI001CDC81A7|nr:hypothetical protein [Deinococcus taeanensis]UBV45179.1 hypothetical protein LAJ19_20430 [Deinococcus taeanensis]